MIRISIYDSDLKNYEPRTKNYELLFVNKTFGNRLVRIYPPVS